MANLTRISRFRSNFTLDDELKRPQHKGNTIVAEIDVIWDVSPKRSKMEPYISLDNLHDDIDLGSLTTQTTKGGGINTNYAEQIVFNVPQGAKQLYLRLRNKKKYLFDDLITSKKINLDQVLLNGYDKVTWEFFDKDGRRGVATLVLRKISVDAANCMPEASTKTIQYDSQYTSYVGSKSGDAFNCTKQ